MTVFNVTWVFMFTHIILYYSDSFSSLEMVRYTSCGQSMKMMTKLSIFPHDNFSDEGQVIVHCGIQSFAMVYYFTSNVVTPAAFIYVGKDKFESKLPRARIPKKCS